MDEILIFGNPIAGRGQGQRIAKRLEKRLSADGYPVHTLLKRPDDLSANEIVRERVHAVIAIGGDGTLRGVADCVARHYTAAGREIPPILVVPLGTANLMGRHLGIRWAEATMDAEVSRVLGDRKIVHLDTARANGSLLLLMAGIGFDGHVVHELAKIRKGPIRMTSYLLPAALAVKDYAYPPLTVWVDDNKVFDRTPGFAFVGNVSEYGTGFPILPHARSDDGLLDVCALPCRAPTDLVQLFLRVMAGEHLEMEGVAYVKGKHVRVESSEPVPVQLDGDEAGHTPIEVDLLPFRLGFIVP